jgi:Protein of unknown function (DUF2891).
MKLRLLAVICFLASFPIRHSAQTVPVLTDEIAVKLSELPLKCIGQEYPNKTAHIINNESESQLTPQKLHPAFYGCFDWHSSVHGHWMLVRLLKERPSMSNRETIVEVLNRSFQKSNLIAEAEYFTKYETADSFERTYGWAWLLKLDEELATWGDPLARQWHENLQPLTQYIVKAWKEYLPKQTYPNRTGVHPNSAFALGFAIDWVRATGDKEFESLLIEKSKRFYLNDQKTPAYLEPDGSDFFSPSLQIADLMRRVLPESIYVKWLNRFYEKQSIENISKIPVVSDITDYQIVHLIGLSFSKAWCMKNIANDLPEEHALKKHFTDTSAHLLIHTLPFVFEGNYGGEHWLASFAVMALE